MKFKHFKTLLFLLFSASLFSQDFSFAELEAMIGKDFEKAESYLLQNSDWEANGEAETKKGIRLKYRNSKREEQNTVFTLVDLYKSEKKAVLIAYSMTFKSSDVYHQYLKDLKSKGYKVDNQIKEKGRYGRIYKKGKMSVITEVRTKKDEDEKEKKSYTINILTNKKYK